MIHSSRKSSMEGARPTRSRRKNMVLDGMARAKAEGDGEGRETVQSHCAMLGLRVPHTSHTVINPAQRHNRQRNLPVNFKHNRATQRKVTSRSTIKSTTSSLHRAWHGVKHCLYGIHRELWARGSSLQHRKPLAL
eukprot:scaffold2785_cov165-Ochromonas_danica.AAC.10